MTMKIKENIFASINKMNTNELAFFYEHIKLFEKEKRKPLPQKHKFSIDQILEMTSSSEDSWAESVIEGR
jgi:hypothetical protein